MFSIDDALRHLYEAGGSDLHLRVGAVPLMRLNGALEPLGDLHPLTQDDTERVLGEILSDPTRRAEFDDEHEVDFAYAIPGLARFRVNAFHQRSTISLVMRTIPTQIRTVSELGLPPVVSELADEERGIILLTGTTGSGKSTTLASIIDHINTNYAKHIVTIEDPIEFLHQDKRSILNQREVGLDTASFTRALRRVLRQDPDVILIGEMRDEETVHTALSAAETGHLVLSTLHTIDAPETVNRIIDFFPPHQQQQARAMLAGTLKGIISQRLVPTPDRRGRVATCEVLRMTGRARDMILDPDQTGRLHEVIVEGEFYGMQTFDQALLHHVQAGRVAMEDAIKVATSPHDFKLLAAAEGRRNTSMGDLVDAGRGSAPAPAAPPTPPAPVAEAAPSSSPTRAPELPPAPPSLAPEPPSLAPTAPPVPVREDPSPLAPERDVVSSLAPASPSPPAPEREVVSPLASSLASEHEVASSSSLAPEREVASPSSLAPELAPPRLAPEREVAPPSSLAPELAPPRLAPEREVAPPPAPAPEPEPEPESAPPPPPVPSLAPERRLDPEPIAASRPPAASQSSLSPAPSVGPPGLGD